MKSHDRTQPMFLYMAFQNVHSPVQAPQKYVDKYKFIKDDVRRTYAGMVDILDEAVGNLTRIFQEHGYSLIPKECSKVAESDVRTRKCIIIALWRILRAKVFVDVSLQRR